MASGSETKSQESRHDCPLPVLYKNTDFYRTLQNGHDVCDLILMVPLTPNPTQPLQDITLPKSTYLLTIIID